MLLRIQLLASSLLLSGACGPELIAQAELGDVCEAPSPFRVLELDPDEHLWSPPLRVADRVFYHVGKRNPDRPHSLFPSSGESAIWTTGPCGEAPVLVATGISTLTTLERWPDVVLGCEQATGNVVSLDPLGIEAPHVVFRDVGDVGRAFGCGLHWTPSGLLVSVAADDGEFGALMLHPYPDDPRSEISVPSVLLDRIRTEPLTFRGLRHVLRVFDDFALALTPDDTLVHVDLASGAISTVQPAVRAFDASSDGRYVIWQDHALTRDDPEYPEGKILLRDRSDDSDAFLTQTSLLYTWSPLRWAEQGVLELSTGPLHTVPLRLFSLPGLEFVELRADQTLSAWLGGDRWLALTVPGGHQDLLDLPSGEQRPLFPRAGQVRYVEDDALHLLEMPLCCIVGDDRDEGPLWRVPLDGSTPQRLAARASRYTRYLNDGRIVSAVNIDDSWRAQMLLIDLASGAEQRLDERVFPRSFDTTRVEDEGIITYSVSDGARSGVYLARLPPHKRSHDPATPGAAGHEPLPIDAMPGPDGDFIAVPRPRAP